MPLTNNISVNFELVYDDGSIESNEDFYKVVLGVVNLIEPLTEEQVVQAMSSLGYLSKPKDFISVITKDIILPNSSRGLYVLNVPSDITLVTPNKFRVLINLVQQPFYGMTGAKQATITSLKAGYYFLYYTGLTAYLFTYLKSGELYSFVASTDLDFITKDVDTFGYPSFGTTDLRVNLKDFRQTLSGVRRVTTKQELLNTNSGTVSVSVVKENTTNSNENTKVVRTDKVYRVNIGEAV